MHPVFRKLIEIKWRRFGKTRCLLQIALQVIFVIIWTTVGIALPRDYKYYNPIKERWWNVTLESIAVLWTFYFIFLVSCLSSSPCGRCLLKLKLWRLLHRQKVCFHSDFQPFKICNEGSIKETGRLNCPASFKTYEIELFCKELHPSSSSLGLSSVTISHRI